VSEFTRPLHKKSSKRQLGVLAKLYTCLREAAPAKAGRNLSAFCYYVYKHIKKVTFVDIACYP